MTLIVPKVWIHFSSSTRTPKSATPSSRAPRTWLLLPYHASCSARAFSANIPDDRQGECFGSRVHAKSSRPQTRRSAHGGTRYPACPQAICSSCDTAIRAAKALCAASVPAWCPCSYCCAYCGRSALWC